MDGDVSIVAPPPPPPTVAENDAINKNNKIFSLHFSRRYSLQTVDQAKDVINKMKEAAEVCVTFVVSLIFHNIF